MIFVYNPVNGFNPRCGACGWLLLPARQAPTIKLVLLIDRLKKNRANNEDNF